MTRNPARPCPADERACLLRTAAGPQGTRGRRTCPRGGGSGTPWPAVPLLPAASAPLPTNRAPAPPGQLAAVAAACLPACLQDTPPLTCATSLTPTHTCNPRPTPQVVPLVSPHDLWPVLACQDRYVRVLRGSVPCYEAPTSAAPTTLKYVLESHDPQQRFPHAKEVLYGTEAGGGGGGWEWWVCGWVGGKGVTAGARSGGWVSGRWVLYGTNAGGRCQ
jgi:hypothetical protein